MKKVLLVWAIATVGLMLWSANRLDAVEVGDDSPSLRVLPGGTLEWPGKLHFGRGGEGHGLPKSGEFVRAQPGGNLGITPLGDHMRSALDIYPTRGKLPDLDAIAELTIHRIHPTDQGHEMLSISGLAKQQDRFSVIVEAHGTGRVKPLEFMMIQGGLLEADEHKEPFWAVPMRMNTDGTMQFGPRRGGGIPAPVDIINIEQEDPTEPGIYHSQVE